MHELFEYGPRWERKKENNLILMTWELEVRLLVYVVYEIREREGKEVLKKECLGILDKDEKGWMHGTMASRSVGASELGRGRVRQQHRRDACASGPRRFARPVLELSTLQGSGITRTLSSSMANVVFKIILRSSSFSSTSKETIWLTKD